MNGTRLTGATRATLLALALAGAAPAAANDLGVAVIVGNKEYADERVSEVSYAHNDAEALRDGRLGFDSDNVIDLRDATKSQLETAFRVKGNAEPKVGDRFRDCPECPEMVVVPAGSYRMGSPSYEQGRQKDEGPVHEVAIAMPFAIGRYEVTVAEFGRFADAAGYSAGNSCRMFEGGKWGTAQARAGAIRASARAGGIPWRA